MSYVRHRVYLMSDVRHRVKIRLGMRREYLDLGGIDAEGIMRSPNPVQAATLFSNYPVTFTRCFFQLLPVENRNPTPTVANDPPFLKRTGDLGDAGALRAEHHGYNVLGKQELVSLYSVVDH